MWKFSLILFTVLAFGTCAGFLSCSRKPASNTNTQPPKGMIGQSKLDANWIYISKDINWKLPPKEITDYMGLFSTGLVYVTVLYPSGELAIIRCFFMKHGKTTQLSLYGISSYDIFTGTWSRNSDGTLTLASRFCVAPGPIGPNNKEPVERRCTVSEQSSNRIGGLITCNQESMVPLPDNFSDVDGFDYMLKSAPGCKDDN